MNRDYDSHGWPGKPFNPYASLRELRRGDEAKFIAAVGHLKRAFSLYEGHDRCRLLAVLEEAVKRRWSMLERIRT